ncbi:hypothetical protein [Streptomyces sp. NPDC056682]|uniref:hypothetical protein n=1 Tax=Streptomyces sp. NPDC056682 TaxID=3345909 RepID=UPI0036B38492
MSILIALAVLYAIACGTLGAEQGASPWLSWPISIWYRIAHDWRRPKAVAVRPDYVKIAILEYDLFGIEPKPNTTAALVIGMRSLKAGLTGVAAMHNEP